MTRQIPHYRREFYRFIREACILGVTEESKTKELYHHYKTWYSSGPRWPAMSYHRFGTELTKLGFPKRRSNGIIRLGIAPDYFAADRFDLTAGR